MILYVRISPRMMDHAYTLSCLGGELLIAKQTSKEPDWRPADIKLMKPIKQHKGRPACVCVTWIYMDRGMSSLKSVKDRWTTSTVHRSSIRFTFSLFHFRFCFVIRFHFLFIVSSVIVCRARTWHWALWSSCGIAWLRHATHESIRWNDRENEHVRTVRDCKDIDEHKVWSSMHIYNSLHIHACTQHTCAYIYAHRPRLQVNVSAPHPAATQCHIVASVYFSFHYITYRNVPCETIPYQNYTNHTHTHHISLVACINLHKCMNARVHYSVLHKLLSVTYIAGHCVTHTHTPHILHYII